MKIKKLLMLFISLILFFSLTSCKKEKEKLTLYAGAYEVMLLTYHHPAISYVPNINLITFSEQGYFKENSEEKIEGYLVEFELTKENFDNGFDNKDEELGWANHEILIKDLRKNNNRAWYVDTGKKLTCYVLIQDNHDVYLVWLYKSENKVIIHNIYKLFKINDYFG
ncbi:MAG: hypothetical protein IJX78_07450 [Bacilli bacterium]|nr:hypothetical protein [Bacilli bacterium]